MMLGACFVPFVSLLIPFSYTKNHEADTKGHEAEKNMNPAWDHDLAHLRYSTRTVH
jgi:hypothetical protein